MGGDGDPLDVLVITEEAAFPGCLIHTHLLGVVEAEQKYRKKTERNDRLVAAALLGEGHSPDPAGSELTTIWGEEWAKYLLQAASARIKRQVHPQQYEIYHLHVLLGRPVDEVKKTLGVTAAQVYLAKHRVGGAMKRELRRLEFSSGVFSK